MADITILILTKNEEKNIVDCLKSVRNFASRVVVVDSGSSDKTIRIAEENGADVYTNEFVNYAKQFNWGLKNTEINTKWTMRLDADERLTPSLCSELNRLMIEHKEDSVNGITMEAWLFFLGKCIKHGGKKKRKLMVFKTGYAEIENREMDEHTVLFKGTSIAAKERFIHYDFKDITFFIDKMNWYASREVKDYINYTTSNNKENLFDDAIAKTRKNKFGIYYKFPKFIRSWLLFVYFYIVKLGFLDGKEGLIYHYLYQRWYRFLVDAKIFEYENKKDYELNGRGPF